MGRLIVDGSQFGGPSRSFRKRKGKNMAEEKPWEKMTLSEQMAAARDRQASFRLEAEVRKAARVNNVAEASTKMASTILQKKISFTFGRVLPVFGSLHVAFRESNFLPKTHADVSCRTKNKRKEHYGEQRL